MRKIFPCFSFLLHTSSIQVSTRTIIFGSRCIFNRLMLELELGSK